ncbi:hypothetical protein M422DRAFT_271173 [Sphaerobolus stellatus SS14]|uniref:Uncharacterized protein n=1 Tax=Sphaerobolus stellatus (strain SS14) TaxID=990650 RepID=A0A0C9TEC0_SPHS4|nr:hypothetical protein M422DRAFT_271173 [Sphaerobolus stellatus SS14]
MSYPHASVRIRSSGYSRFTAQPSGHGRRNIDDDNVSRPRDLTKLVRIPHDISVLYAQPVQPHHEPYYDLKPSHLKRMNRVLHALVTDAGGSTVEHGIAKAKQLLKEGENPDLLRHAFGIYLTHSRDSQKRQIIVPPLKEHASMLKLRTAASPTTVNIVGGQVVTLDTQQGPAILAYWREDYYGSGKNEVRGTVFIHWGIR